MIEFIKQSYELTVKAYGFRKLLKKLVKSTEAINKELDSKHPNDNVLYIMFTRRILILTDIVNYEFPHGIIEDLFTFERDLKRSNEARRILMLGHR